jgi:integrase
MRVIFPIPSEMNAAGYQSLAYCPFLLSCDGSYLDAPNRYLRERGLCEWLPKLRSAWDQDTDVGGIEFQTKESCGAMARRLLEFLLWCNAKALDWENIQYSTLINEWQAGMLSGTCSRSGRKLVATTVNGRVHEATLFLVWASERGLREGFIVPLKSVASQPRPNGRQPTTKAAKQAKKRIGVVSTPPSKLLLPDPKEVGVWLHQVRLLKGPVKGLCCELIASTGIRISECIQWRVDTLPKREDWQIIDDDVSCTIRFGVKGPKISPGSLEGTKPREILVPLDLAERIDHYQKWQRPTQIRRWIAASKTKQERDRRARSAQPSQLWLGEKSNRPFSKSQLYQDWKGVPACPANWHPHAGREFFAVELIVEHTRLMMKTNGQTTVPPMNWLIGAMSGQVRIIVMPLLGHVNEETTNLYLRAARARLVMEIGHPAMRWQDYVDAEE